MLKERSFMMKGQIIDFNDHWKFLLSGESSLEKMSVDDTHWRMVDLPHDWSVEFPFDEDLGEGCTGYLPGGIGWYRKHFVTPEDNPCSVLLNFDGIYNHATIFVNGQEVTHRPFGYVPITVNVTDYLRPQGEDNVIAVRVDHSRYADSRWYTGSGIYRKVKMMVVEPLYIPFGGTYVTTPVIHHDQATVHVDVTVANDATHDSTFNMVHEITDPSGKKIAEVNGTFHVPHESQKNIAMDMTVTSPLLWDVLKPNVYQITTSLYKDADKIQSYTTSFGIRSIRFDVNEGFFINGINTLIKGVCLHHDGGIVGAAVPMGVWERRLKKLMEGGCNAIRCAHNPPSEEFLDLCDRLGLLVQNEFFDEWDNPKDKRLNTYERHDDYISRGYAEDFQKWAEKDLHDIMIRDRNHPCIIQWSIGNEIEWPYAPVIKATGYFDADASGNYFWTQPPYGPEKIKERYQQFSKETYTIEKTARKLSDWTKALDTTRPVIANCILPSGSHAAGATDAMDMVGYSYRRIMYDFLHEAYPDKIMMGTENLGQWHEWKAVLDRPFISGIYIWTGIDYLGESHNAWPKKSTHSGLLNLAGFEKPSYHMMKSLWLEEPVIAIYTQKASDSIFKPNASGVLEDTTQGGWEQRLWYWHTTNPYWNYTKGEETVVEVYTNCQEVELFLNDTSLGRKALDEFDDHIMKWAVPFSSGQLTAVGYDDKGPSTDTSLITTGDITGIELLMDKDVIHANKEDVVHVTAQLVDGQHHPIRCREAVIDFHVEGDCRILGVDNGYYASTQNFQSTQIKTHEGRCLLLLQAEDIKGLVRITASSQGITSSVADLHIQ